MAKFLLERALTPVSVAAPAPGCVTAFADGPTSPTKEGRA